jgi:putative membrane protein
MKHTGFAAAATLAFVVAGGGFYADGVHAVSRMQPGAGQTGGAATPQPPADAPKQKPTKGKATKQGGRMDTRTFITRTTIANLAEVRLGELASEHAENPDVKAFGQMMVKDHTEANKELAQVAAQAKVTPPTELDQRHRAMADRLSKLKGAAFDREYIRTMVQAHEQVAGQLRSRAEKRMTSTEPGAKAGGSQATGGQTKKGAKPVGTSGDPQLEQAVDSWAAKMLPNIERHLERARELQKKVAK